MYKTPSIMALLKLQISIRMICRHMHPCTEHQEKRLELRCTLYFGSNCTHAVQV